MFVYGCITVFSLPFLFSRNVNAGKAGAFYCDFGYCDSDQDCCGDNKCCDRLLDLWFLWLGIGIIIVVVAIVLFLKYYLKRKSRNCKDKLESHNCKYKLQYHNCKYKVLEPEN